METNTPDLFSDESLEKTCSICGLGLQGPIVKHEKLDGEAHCTCVAECVAAGDFHTDEIVEMEKQAGLKDHALLCNHPSVLASGCSVCSKPVFADDLVILSKTAGNVAVSHRLCIGECASIDKNPAFLVSLARVNDMAWDALLGDQIRCSSCSSPFRTTPLVVGSKLYHAGCIAAEMQRGMEFDVVKTAELNGMSTAKLQSHLDNWQRIYQFSKLKAEADGMISGLWERFKSWLSSVGQSLEGIHAAYDAGISALEQATVSLGDTEIATAAGLRVKAIEEEVQKAMDLLTKLMEAEEAREARLADIQREGNITNLASATADARSKVGNYLATLKAKQRKYGRALFRFKEVSHRSAFDSKGFRAALKALHAADAAMTAEFDRLEAANTKAGFKTNEVEVLLEHAPIHPEVQQISTPAPAQRIEPAVLPGNVPQQRTESSLFNE